MGVGEEALTATPPRVSVIVPVRDRRELLRETLDALARQTFPDFEVIVVDDGSQDGSGDEARAETVAGRAVRVFESGGAGAIAARTVGVAHAVGDVLAFTDSDCVPDPDWLAAGVGAIDRGADVVQGLTTATRAVRPLERTVWSLRDDGLFATCNVIYRRTSFDAAGGFDAGAGNRLGFRPGRRLRDLGFGEDTLLGWRVRRAGLAVFEPAAVVRHQVLAPDVADSFRRTWAIGAFPALFREVPELATLLGPDLRRGRATRALLWGSVWATAARRRGLAAALLGSLVAVRWRHLTRTEPSLKRRLAVLPVDVALEAVRAVALAWGGIRTRRWLW